MHSVLEFLVKHGYLVLLTWVFLEQAGFPLPSIPLLLAAGALSGMHRMSLLGVLALCVVAALAADSLWYQLGRRKGIKVIQLLCRISLEPDSCVRRTEGVFEKQGARSLLYAKFIPGLSTVATPLAGVFHMRFRRFLLFDALGSVIWAGTFLGLGFLFRDQIEHIAERIQSLGAGAVVLLLGLLAIYIAYKFIGRRKFLRGLRISRITVDELKQKIDQKEDLAIVDLRHSLDFEADPETIPGAFRMDARDLQEKENSLPMDRDIILYCT
jgi:membrane protein DedA with SNARE-associated domain